MNQLNNLITTMRFSGFPLVKPESVSDHIWGMISIALVDIPQINEQRKSMGLQEVDIKELIYKIVLHDLDEAYTSDIPRLFKHSDPNLLEAIKIATNKLISKYLDPKLIEEIDKAKDESLEGLWVELLDMIQCGDKMIYEIKLGNEFIKTQLPNVISTLSDIMQYLIVTKGGTLPEVGYISNKISHFELNL